MQSKPRVITEADVRKLQRIADQYRIREGEPFDGYEPKDLPLDKVFRQNKAKFSSRTLELLRAKEVDDRSSRMFELGALLREDNVPFDHAFLLLDAVKWNKFRNRSDHIEQVWKCLTKPQEDSPEPAPSYTPPHGGDPFIRGNDLLMRPLPKPEWLVKDILSKQVFAVVAGRAKTYKSTLTTDLAVSVATGTDFFGRFPVLDPGPVIIVQEENDEALHRDRIKRIAQSRQIEMPYFRMEGRILEQSDGDPRMDDIHSLSNYGFRFDDEDAIAMLENKIAVIEPKLVILDPLYLMIRGDVSNHNDVRDMVRWIVHVKTNFETTILLVHHNKKENPDHDIDAQEMLFGSSYIANAFDDALLMRPHKTGDGVRVTRRYRRWKRQPFDFTIQMTEDLDDYEAVVEDGSEAQHPLIDLLQANPKGLTMTQCAELLGISRQAVVKAAQTLKLPHKELPSKRQGGRKKVKLLPPDYVK